MEKYSEPEREKQDVTSMSTEEKLHLSEKGAAIECPKCRSLTSRSTLLATMYSTVYVNVDMSGLNNGNR